MVLRSEIILTASALLATTAAFESYAKEGARPRGVGPDFAKFYKSTSEFTCISNPSIKIPFSRVNDDFCDCPDGSDEPGTAACAYLSSLSPFQYAPGPSNQPAALNLSLPGFYCKNKGHIPSYLTFESVNDGKCDYDVCCDGSDEYDGVGGVKCPDKCGEIGKIHKQQEEIRNKAFGNAMRKRKEYLATAAALRAELEAKKDALQTKIHGGRRKVEEATANLQEVERAEQLKVVQGDATGKKTGKLGVLLTLSKARVEELRGALEKTTKHRDSMIDRIGELEKILASLKEDFNPNFNDEGVKRAVRAWEDYAVRETNDHWTDAEYRDMEEIVKQDGEETGVHWSEFESGEEAEDDVAALYRFTNYLPPSLQAWVDEKITAIRGILVDNGVLAGTKVDSSATESQAVQNARQALTEAEKQLEDAKTEMSNTWIEIDRDFGPESVFRALRDKCIQKDSGEYTYELCFMGSTKQISKKGGSHTGMGNFVGFDSEEVDEEMPADGKGLGKGKKIVMKYENGQNCWNGPNRSTKVILACSETEELWKISESEKCVYRMEVGTPAVCGVSDHVQEKPHPFARKCPRHEEL